MRIRRGEPATAAPEPTLVAGRYRLVSQIGRGGMATVHRAVDTQLGREVAVKLMRPELGDDEVFRGRFVNEARNAASITHPNVVTVHDFGTDGPGPYIVMELVDGGDLAKLIAAEAPLAPIRAASLAAEVASALQAAHAHGIVHRDVKPGNILLGADGHPRVADFGIARATGEQSLTGTGTSLGSVEYFSPEQARGEQATAASDIYALGVVLYEMLTGQRPFEGDSPYATAVARVDSPPPDPRTVRRRVPKALAAIVQRAMAPEPHARFPSAAEMARALETWASRSRATADRRDAGSGLLAGAAAAASAAIGSDSETNDDTPTQPVVEARRGSSATTPSSAPAVAAAPNAPSNGGSPSPDDVETRPVAIPATSPEAAARGARARKAPESSRKARTPAVPVAALAAAPLAAAAAATATAIDPPPGVPRDDARADAAPAGPPAPAPPAAAPPTTVTTFLRRRTPWLLAAAAVLLLGLIGFAGGRLLGGAGEPGGDAFTGVIVGEPQGEVLSGTPEPTRTPRPTVEPTEEPTPEPSEEPTPTPVPVAATTPAPAAAAPPPPPPATPAPTPVAVAMAITPDQTVATWYSYVEDGQFDAAYALWSERMRRDYPRQPNLDNRWRNTADVNILDIYVVEQTATYASVQIDFIETYDNGSTRRFIGWWELIRSGDGWLLDQPHF